MELTLSARSRCRHVSSQAATVLGLLHLACSLVCIRYPRQEELAALDL
ncbi:MAG TPA: hypothetical protein VFH48_09310 [Chloroflexota bacterium]|nr:hypothetical protein [Chloroflexota bacterium]